MSEASRKAASSFVVAGDLIINLDHVTHVEIELRDNRRRVVIHYDVVIGDQQVSIALGGTQAEKIVEFFRENAGGRIGYSGEPDL